MVVWAAAWGLLRGACLRLCQRLCQHPRLPRTLQLRHLHALQQQQQHLVLQARRQGRGGVSQLLAPRLAMGRGCRRPCLQLRS